MEAGTSDEDWPDYLSNGLIKDFLGKIKSFHTFLIADSCFSGSLFIDKSREKFTGDRLDSEPSRWGLTSGKKEVVSDGRPGQHSPFAAALLDVLRKAEAPLGVMSICDRVVEKVLPNAQQTPLGSPLQVPGHQGGQMVLYLQQDEDADWADLQKSVAGCKTYLDKYPHGKFRVVAEATLTKHGEESAWEKAKSTGSKSALLDYEFEFPHSAPVLSGELHQVLARIEDEELWRDAKKSDTITAYRVYLIRSIMKLYSDEAESIIKAKAQEEREQKQQQRSNEPKVNPLPKKGEKTKPFKLSPTLKRAGLGLAGLMLLLFLGTRIWNAIAAQNAKTDSSKTTSDPTPDTDTSFIAPEMVLIPAGSFKMGSNEGESDEKPVHEVQLDSFYLAKYEVTVGEFKKFIENTGYQTDADKDGGSNLWNGNEWEKENGVNWKYDAEGNVQPTANYDHPEIHVSWNDATAYTKWLSKKTGLNYRLPTEAEWEYAAGNGSKHTKYSWGNGDPLGKQGGNVADETGATRFNWAKSTENIFVSYNDGFASTAPIGSFNANELGLYDMSGNVWEWCQDWYGNDYYAKSPASNPGGSTSGTLRVCRGGSWFRNPALVRVANRNLVTPSHRYSNIGFRLARQQ